MLVLHKPFLYSVALLSVTVKIAKHAKLIPANAKATFIQFRSKLAQNVPKVAKILNV